jgi:hypothetical protein
MKYTSEYSVGAFPEIIIQERRIYLTNSVRYYDFLFFFPVLGVWTQGLVLTRQTLYHLSHSPTHTPFLIWLFLREGLAFMSGQPVLQSSHLCFLHSWNDSSTPSTLLLLFEMRSYGFFAYASLEPSAYPYLLPK